MLLSNLPILLLYECDDRDCRNAFNSIIQNWPHGVISPVLCLAFSRNPAASEINHDLLPEGYRLGQSASDHCTLKNHCVYPVTRPIKLKISEPYWSTNEGSFADDLLTDVVESYARVMGEKGVILNCTRAFHRETLALFDTPVMSSRTGAELLLIENALRYLFSHRAPLKHRVRENVDRYVENITGIDIKRFHQGWLFKYGFSDGVEVHRQLSLSTSPGTASKMVQRLLEPAHQHSFSDQHIEALATWLDEKISQTDELHPVKVWLIGGTAGNLARLFDALLQRAPQEEPVLARLTIYSSAFTNESVKQAQAASKHLQQLLPDSPRRARVQRLWRKTVLHSQHNLFVDAAYSDIDLIICPWLAGALIQSERTLLFQILAGAQRPGGALMLASEELPEVDVMPYNRPNLNNAMLTLPVSDKRIRHGTSQTHLPKVVLSEREPVFCVDLDAQNIIQSAAGAASLFCIAPFSDSQSPVGQPIKLILNPDLADSADETLLNVSDPRQRRRLVLTKKGVILLSVEGINAGEATKRLHVEQIENVDLNIGEPLPHKVENNSLLAAQHVLGLQTQIYKEFKALETLSMELAADNDVMQSQIVPLRDRVDSLARKTIELEDSLQNNRPGDDLESALFSRNTIPLLICRNDGGIVTANAAVLELMGREPHQFTHLADPTLDLPVTKLLEKLTELHAHQEPLVFNAALPTSKASAQFILSPLPASDGNEPLIQIQLLETDNQPIAEADFIHGLDLLGIGSVLTDSEGYVQFIDQRVSDWIAEKSPSFVNQKFSVLLHEPYRAGFLQQFSALTKGEPIDYEAPLRPSSGEGTWVRIRTAQIHPEHSDHHLFLVENIKQRKQDQRETLVTQKLEVLGQITGGVAHDFNNILAVVMGYIDLMYLDPGGLSEEQLERYLEQMQDACRRARDLIKQMLFYSRGDAQQHTRRLNLCEAISTSLPLIRTSLQSSINLSTNMDTRVPPVDMDPSHLDQILLNLCINARDALKDCTERDPEIVIAVSHGYPVQQLQCASCPGQFSVQNESEYLVLSVTDNGKGISPETLDQMFDPFFSTKPVSQGSGMGLSVVHGLVHQYKGHLQVLSSNYGVQFRLWIPTSQHTESTTPEVPIEADVITSLPARNVLLVEDDLRVAKVIKEMLTQLNLKVYHCSSGADAINILDQAADIHLVVTDLTMPGVDGLDVTRYCETNHPDIDVIILTANATQLASGDLPESVSVLKKPTTIQQISQTLELLRSDF